MRAESRGVSSRRAGKWQSAGKIQVPATADNAEVEALAKANPNVQRFIQDATIKKVIVIPQKLVNIVAQ